MRLSLVAIALVLIGSSAFAQKAPSDEMVEKYIDALAEQQAGYFQIPGLAIGVVRDGKVIYQKAFGVQSLNSKVPLSTQSLFHMASVSKPFVATAMVIAEAEGLLQLDDKLVKHLPYFSMASPEYQDITLRQMLAHTAGIPDVDDYEWGNPDASDAAVEAYSKSFARTTLDFKPSTDFSYSNAAFDLLADVIAKTTGMTFEDYVEKRILRPAGMKESNFSKLAINPVIATESHIPNDDLILDVNPVYPYNRIHAPSSSLHANVEDMLRWAQLYLGEGTLDGQTVFTPAQYTELTTSNYNFRPNSDVCLSWFKAKAFGDDFYNHSGGDPGFSTFFGFVPEQGFAITVMANNDIVDASNLAGIIISYTLKGKEREWPKPPVYLPLGPIIMKEGIEGLKKAWQEQLNAKPQRYAVEPHYLDDLGYALIDKNQFEKAVEVFKFMVELEPKEGGWHDSVGDAYRAWGKFGEAEKWYVIAVKKGFEDSAGKIEAMKKQE